MAVTNHDSELDIDPMFISTHNDLWLRLGSCGTWWTGPQRVAAMSEVRAAFECDLCSERSEALSPLMIEGVHDSVSELPPEAVDLVHRLTTDPGRLTQPWANTIIDVLGEERYVEIVTVVCVQYVIESFARNLGLPLPDLPEAATEFLITCDQPMSETSAHGSVKRLTKNWQMSPEPHL